VCLPRGVAQSPDAPVYARKRLKRDDVLCRMGAPLESLYAVRNGFFESRTTVQDGREQVTGFHMPGDIVGVEAMASGMRGAAVFALEDAEVCVIPYARLDHPLVQRHLRKAMTDELVRARGMMLALGMLSADERIAAFLVGFSRRMRELGYARDDFYLRMKRHDIGSYLGVSLETVSRTLTRFRRAGVIAVAQKHIRILDMPALRALASIAH
jgi:CRP/FNR family transcriptional regulator